MSVLPECMHGYHVCIWFGQWSDSKIRFCGKRILDDCKPSCRCVEDAGPLQDGQMILTTEPSLQILNFIQFSHT